jgi:DNA-binding response OmpR family regulator
MSQLEKKHRVLTPECRPLELRQFGHHRALHLPDMPRLLVIDDDTDLRSALTEYFLSLGYEVHQAVEREEAEALLEHYAYTLVITDISLTELGVEGFDLLRAISNSNSRPKLIVVSGHADSRHHKLAKQCGADVFLQKPTALATLGEAVRACLSPQHAQKAL